MALPLPTAGAYGSSSGAPQPALISLCLWRSRSALISSRASIHFGLGSHDHLAAAHAEDLLELGEPSVVVGEVQLQDRPAVLREDGRVTAGLGGDEVTEGEVATGDGEVLLRCGGDLQVDADRRTARRPLRSSTDPGARGP